MIDSFENDMEKHKRSHSQRSSCQEQKKGFKRQREITPAIRLEANRKSARQSRKRKKVMVEQMKKTISRLTIENHKLKSNNKAQQEEIALIRTLFFQDLASICNVSTFGFLNHFLLISASSF